jgi:3-dehydroquinate synthetase
MYVIYLYIYYRYGAWLHGEAVAAGTVMAAEMSQELGIHVYIVIYICIDITYTL